MGCHFLGSNSPRPRAAADPAAPTKAAAVLGSADAAAAARSWSRGVMLWIERRATSPPPSAPLPQPRLLLSRGAREYTAKMLCTPLTSLWFVRYHLPWFSVVRHRPVIRIVLLRLPPIEPVFLFYAFCGHLMKG